MHLRKTEVYVLPNKYVAVEGILEPSCNGDYLHQIIMCRKGNRFDVPIRAWLRRELREEVADLLLISNWYGSECFDLRPLKQAVVDFLDHDRGNEWGIWILYAWQKWARQSGLN